MAAKVELTHLNGRSSITIDGVRVPHTTAIEIKTDVNGGPYAIVTIRVLADEVTVDAEADVEIQTKQAELKQQVAELNDVSRRMQDLGKAIGEEFAKRMRPHTNAELARIAMRGHQRFANGGPIGMGGGEHTWVETTTIAEKARGRAHEHCSRCAVHRTTVHGYQPDPMGTCRRRHPDDHTT